MHAGRARAKVESTFYLSLSWVEKLCFASYIQVLRVDVACVALFQGTGLSEQVTSPRSKAPFGMEGRQATSLCVALLQGPKRGLFLMSEVPLYPLQGTGLSVSTPRLVHALGVRVSVLGC